MTTNEIRAEMNKAIEAMHKQGDNDIVARMEVVREYLTNPEFKARLEAFIYKKNQ